MANPIFSSLKNNDQVYDNSSCATYRGITLKTIYFLVLAIASAVASILLLVGGELEFVLIFLGISSFVGFISFIIGRGSPRAAKVCGSIYSICEGFALGAISIIGEIFYPGSAGIAIIATVLVFATMLGIFASGIIRNKNRIQRTTISIGLCTIVVLLATMILSFIPAFNAWFANPGIIFAIEALVLVYACFTLLSGFVEATTLVQNGFGKEYEWTCAFGLSFSILYIYLEILRIVWFLYSLFRRD